MKEIYVFFLDCLAYVFCVRLVTKQVPWPQRRWVQVLSVGLCIGSLALHAKKRPVPSVPTTSLTPASPCPAPSACVCTSGERNAAAPTRIEAFLTAEERSWRSSLPVCSAAERQTWLDGKKPVIAELEPPCTASLQNAVAEEAKEQGPHGPWGRCLKLAIEYVDDVLLVSQSQGDEENFKRCEPMNRSAGLQLLTRLCEQERDTRACRTLAHKYKQPENVAIHPQQALRLLLNTCTQQQVGCSTLGAVLANPAAPDYNPREALSLLETACKVEGGSSCLHVLRIREKAGAPFVGAERLRWLVRACDDQNDATRQACEEASKVILEGHWSFNGVPVPATSPVPNTEPKTPVPEPAQVVPSPAPVPAAPEPVPTPSSPGSGPQPAEAPSSGPLPEEPAPPVVSEEDSHE